ncbi:MAG: hypothetical protein COB15_00110 [Flavobacteriales bacterium]|nr:MAG: hypothetical protein COB15_00110 [Flavobacteriales bacterium]
MATNTLSFMQKYVNYITRFLFLFVIFFMAKPAANASHLVGGSMFYECLSNNFYRITLTVYRDCSAATPFDINAPISIFNAGGQLISTEMVPQTSTSNVPIIINNPCLISPPNVCIQRAEYTFTTTIAPSAGGLEVVYQRCCRNSNAINIVSPSTMGSTYKVHIPDPSLASCNNSPKFNNTPPTIMCMGYQFDYDLSANDPDGDSLLYEFADVLNGGSINNPAPSPTSPPPYSNITWNTGYSTNYQIDANPQFTIDPQTGLLSGTPTSAGFYTFGIKVKEYRNGVYLNEINRDFLLVVMSCQVNTVADFPVQTDFCTGTTVQFQNSSLNTSLSFWDFGELSINADTSLLWSPIHTFSDTGTFNIMLIANPGYFCADTIFHEYTIHEDITPFFNSPDDQCLLNNVFELSAIGSNPTDSISWVFGSSATSNTTTGDTVNVSFASLGSYPIELTIKNHGCNKNYIDTITILDNPTAIFSPQTIFCDGLNVSFNNNSNNATHYFWDFDDGSTINNLIAPTHNYADSGIYNVSLIASQQGVCYDTTLNIYNVYPALVGTFTPQATQCFPNNSFTLNALGNFNSTAIINWNYGPSGVPTTSTGAQTQVSFSDTGSHAVSLTIQNYGCSSSYHDTLFVFPLPKANFTLLAKAGCQPFSTSFEDDSFSWSPLSYHWDFGDGNTSSSSNPTHTYLNPGIFDVSLTIITNSGCIDTNTLLLNNLITVNPKPESKFIINPVETYFLNHVITAEDQSGVFFQEFHFGDGNVYTDRQVDYSYMESGHYLFEQFVINEFNCKDSSSQEIWIKPDFLFIVPNTFTPNGDGLNDYFFPVLRGLDAEGYTFSIYDRWGELLFQSRNVTSKWDGTFKGQPSPTEVYTWRIKLKTIDFKIHERTGQLNLLR